MLLLVDLDAAAAGQKRQKSEECDEAADEYPGPFGFLPGYAGGEHDEKGKGEETGQDAQVPKE